MVYISPPSDRIVQKAEIDIVNDGLPNLAGVTLRKVKQKNHAPLDYQCNDDSIMMDGYLRMHWILRKPFAKEWFKTGDGLSYAVYWGWAREEGGIVWARSFVTIDSKTGTIFPAKRHIQYYNGYKHVTKTIKDQLCTDEDKIPMSAVVASVTIGFWQDRCHLWNVIAQEINGKATFGVYKEEVKSLFYARDLPLSQTGRRRPILHWVAAHRRRMKEGIEVNVKKHLRGINKFEMGGTTFEITRPYKQ